MHLARGDELCQFLLSRSNPSGWLNFLANVQRESLFFGDLVRMRMLLAWSGWPLAFPAHGVVDLDVRQLLAPLAREANGQFDHYAPR